MYSICVSHWASGYCVFQWSPVPRCALCPGWGSTKPFDAGRCALSQAQDPIRGGETGGSGELAFGARRRTTLTYKYSLTWFLYRTILIPYSMYISTLVPARDLSQNTTSKSKIICTVCKSTRYFGKMCGGWRPAPKFCAAPARVQRGAGDHWKI